MFFARVEAHGGRQEQGDARRSGGQGRDDRRLRRGRCDAAQQRIDVRVGRRGVVEHHDAVALAAGRHEAALPVFVPVRELVCVVRIAARDDPLARDVFRGMNPHDRQHDLGPDAEPPAVEDAAIPHFARQRADHEHADAEREVLAGRVEQALVLGVPKVLQVERAVAIVRIGGEGAHRGRAVAAVERVLVEQAECFAGRAHQRPDQPLRERGLAGAGMTAEEHQVRHECRLPGSVRDVAARLSPREKTSASSHIALMMPKPSATPMPSIHEKYHMGLSP